MADWSSSAQSEVRADWPPRARRESPMPQSHARLARRPQAGVGRARPEVSAFHVKRRDTTAGLRADIHPPIAVPASRDGESLNGIRGPSPDDPLSATPPLVTPEPVHESPNVAVKTGTGVRASGRPRAPPGGRDASWCPPLSLRPSGAAGSECGEEFVGPAGSRTPPTAACANSAPDATHNRPQLGRRARYVNQRRSATPTAARAALGVGA